MEIKVLFLGTQQKCEQLSMSLLYEDLVVIGTVVEENSVLIVALDNTFYSSGKAIGEAHGSCTLEVTMSEAVKIALLKDDNEKIKLALRPLKDECMINEPHVSVLQRYAR